MCYRCVWLKTVGKNPCYDCVYPPFYALILSATDATMGSRKRRNTENQKPQGFTEEKTVTAGV
ncbi:MAG: hypothetical protein IJM47_06215 [Synergistaceae bacterium]|nr:hypothetical protein [Synergistaceae bacterium]